MSRDGYLTLGALLTPEEAGMAHDLLASAGLDVLLEDQALSSVDPLVRLAIGGTKLLVLEADAARARALLDEAGLLSPASARPAEDVEIPEAEWSAPPPPEPPPDPDEPRWSGGKVLVLLVTLLAAAAAILAESGRPRWPPWGR
jgi:hypothetical protein